MKRARDPRPLLEDKIQQAIVELLRLKGHRDLIFYHIPNERECSIATMEWLKKMGLLPGAADLGFVRLDGSAAFIEVKGPRGVSTVEQSVFAGRCEAIGVPYYQVRSVDEAEAVLRSWGALRVRRAA